MLVNGRYWYKTLKDKTYNNGKKSKGLLSKMDTTQKTIIIRWETYNYGYLFGQFEIDDFIKFYNDTDDEDKVFHEIILGNKKQKIRFDIDIEKKDMKTISNSKWAKLGDKVKNKLIDCLLETLEENGEKVKKDKNILVFDSTKDDKWSYHIILYGYYVNNAQSAKEFCQDVVNKMDKYEQFIDMSIYKDIQSLRMLGCHKLGENDRDKRLLFKWKYHEENIKYRPYHHTNNVDVQNIIILLSTLITSTTGCQPLKSLGKKKVTKKVYNNNNSNNTYDLARINTEEYQDMVDEQVGKGIYLVSNIESNKIQLLRQQPAYCSICSKIHDKDNAQLWVTNNGKLMIKCWGGSGGGGSKMLKDVSYKTKKNRDHKCKKRIEKTINVFDNADNIFYEY